MCNMYKWVLDLIIYNKPIGFYVKYVDKLYSHCLRVYIWTDMIV